MRPDPFAHVPAADKQRALQALIQINPHLRGIDFDTLMEMILDTDAHLALIGDVPLTPETARRLVERLGGGMSENESETGKCQQVWGYDEPPQHQHRCTRALRHQGAHLCNCGDGTSKGIK